MNELATEGCYPDRPGRPTAAQRPAGAGVHAADAHPDPLHRSPDPRPQPGLRAADRRGRRRRGLPPPGHASPTGAGPAPSSWPPGAAPSSAGCSAPTPTPETARWLPPRPGPSYPAWSSPTPTGSPPRAPPSPRRPSTPSPPSPERGDASCTGTRVAGAEGSGDTSAVGDRWRAPRQTVRTILPRVRPVALSSQAFAASASGRACSTLTVSLPASASSARKVRSAVSGRTQSWWAPWAAAV